MTFNPYDAMDQPPPSEFPPNVQWSLPGTYVVGEITGVRVFVDKEDGSKKPVWDMNAVECSHGATANMGQGVPGAIEVGMKISVICSPASLHRQALALAPLPGATVRVSYDSPSGNAKNFSVQLVAGPTAQPSQAAPAPQSQPQAPTPAAPPVQPAAPVQATPPPPAPVAPPAPAPVPLDAEPW